METRSGKVVKLERDAKVSARTGKPYSVHSVVLDTGDTIEVGFKQPYRVGADFNSEVEFGFGKWKELKALPPGSAPAATTRTAEVQAAPMQFPIPKSSKETAIIRQNALTNAVNATNTLINAGCVDKPASAEEYTDGVLTLAYKFAEFSSGQREIRMSKELVGDSED